MQHPSSADDYRRTQATASRHGKLNSSKLKTLHVPTVARYIKNAFTSTYDPDSSTHAQFHMIHAEWTYSPSECSNRSELNDKCHMKWHFHRKCDMAAAKNHRCWTSQTSSSWWNGNAITSPFKLEKPPLSLRINLLIAGHASMRLSSPPQPVQRPQSITHYMPANLSEHMSTSSACLKCFRAASNRQPAVRMSRPCW